MRPSRRWSSCERAALVIGDRWVLRRRKRTAGRTGVRHAVPADLARTRELAAAGGLMSYGASVAD